MFWSMTNFNSRAHVERDFTSARSRRNVKQFQLTRSRGARLVRYWGYDTQGAFQLTRSRGARPDEIEELKRYYDFNSRAHVERDSNKRRLHSRPTTFQLTRSRGARQYCFFNTGLEMNFNSRAHVERDIRRRGHKGKARHFNSRAHVERDELYVSTAIQRIHFNSRAHVERDICGNSRGGRMKAHFNSRAHVERDHGKTV